MSDQIEFVEFPKIARLSRPCVITEKIDGTNGVIYIAEDGQMLIGSRTQWLTLDKPDNHGFRAWALTFRDELLTLGAGTHYGEWWGSGIQRGYGLEKGEKRFSLFNIARWADDRDTEKFPTPRPSCCSVVPVLWRGLFDTREIQLTLDALAVNGSSAAPGFMKPEGVVVFHEQGRILFKKTIDKDEEWKGKSK